MKLRYVFGTRTLPDLGSHPISEVKNGDGLGQAPGGYIDWSGSITKAEYDAYPSQYAYGVKLRIYDDDDPGQPPVWAGDLTDPQESGGNVILQAQGVAKKADRNYDRLLWQTMDLSQFTTADSDPLNYDNDPQIDVKIHGNREIQFKIPKKSVFRRPTGIAKLTADAASGDDKVEISHAGFLKRGDTITIGGIARTVKDTYNKGDTTVPLTTTLGTAKATGTAVSWSVPAGPDWWRSAAAGWYPTVNLTRMGFDIHKPNGKDSDYTLELARGIGPDGALTVDSSTSMGSNTTSKDIVLSGSPDLVVPRLARSNEAKTKDGYVVRLRNVIVAALANTIGPYTSSAVAGDVFDYLGGTKTVQSSSTNAMPLDSEDASLGDVLDFLCFLDDFVWLALDDGTQTDWRFREWGGSSQNRVWKLVRPEFPVSLQPVPRFNRVIVPYRYPGGQKQTLRVIASPNPMGTPYVDYRVDLEDPLPSKAVAQILGQILANYLSQIRYAGTATFHEVEDLAAPGVTVSASRVRPGDKIVTTYQGNHQHRVSEIHILDSKVQVTFPEIHPLLNRLSVKRRLLQQRGKDQLHATIGALGLRKPNPPVISGTPTFRVQKKKHHHQDYDAVLDWAEVTTDVNDQPTYIKKYIAQRMYVDSGGTQISGTHVQTISIKDRDLQDNADDVPTRAIFRDLEHPAGYYVKFRVKAVDVLHKESDWTSWTSPLLPQAVLDSAPPAPSLTRFVIHQHGADVEWDVGTDSDDATAESATHVKEADQRHHRFKYLLINPAGTIVRRSRNYKGFHKHFKLEKPGTGTWTFKLWSVNSNGTESSLSFGTASRGDPLTPASPGVAITQAGKLKLKATVAGSYDLDAYTEDDIDSIRVSFIHAGNEREHTIKVPKESTGIFSYSTVFHGVEEGDSTSSKTKAHGKNRQESAWSSVSSVTAGAGAKIAGGDISVTSLSDITPALGSTTSGTHTGTAQSATGSNRVSISDSFTTELRLTSLGSTAKVIGDAGVLHLQNSSGDVISLYGDQTHFTSGEIVHDNAQLGYAAIHIAAAQVAAGDTFGHGVTFGGATRCWSSVSSVTFTTVGTDSNVASVAAADITTRGFVFKATSTSAGTFLKAARTYVAS